MCEKREKRFDRSLPRSPRTRSASPPDARASPHAATWPVSGINSQLLTVGAPIGAPTVSTYMAGFCNFLAKYLTPVTPSQYWHGSGCTPKYAPTCAETRVAPAHVQI